MTKVSAVKHPPEGRTTPYQEPRYLRPRFPCEIYYLKSAFLDQTSCHHKLLFQNIVRVQQPIRARNHSQSAEPWGRTRQSASLFQPGGGNRLWRRGGGAACREEGEFWEWVLHHHVERENHLDLGQCLSLKGNVKLGEWLLYNHAEEQNHIDNVFLWTQRQSTQKSYHRHQNHIA